MPEPSSSHPIANSDILAPEDAREFLRLLGILLRHDPTGAEIRHMLQDAGQQQIRPDAGGDRSQLASKARAAFSERKRRSQFFDSIMFGEPAWDILLALYITDHAGGRQTIGKLTDWVRKPSSTTIRWINFLVEKQLITRVEHPRDRRATLIALTDRGREVMDNYLRTLPYALTAV